MVTSLAEKGDILGPKGDISQRIWSSERGLGRVARCPVALRFPRVLCQLAALLHQPIAPARSSASRWTRYLVTCLSVTPRSEARGRFVLIPRIGRGPAS